MSSITMSVDQLLAARKKIDDVIAAAGPCGFTITELLAERTEIDARLCFKTDAAALAASTAFLAAQRERAREADRLHDPAPKPAAELELFPFKHGENWYFRLGVRLADGSVEWDWRGDIWRTEACAASDYMGELTEQGDIIWPRVRADDF